MKSLKNILFGVDILQVKNYDLNDSNLNIEGICFDSRQVKDNYLFVAQKGEQTDGHLYIGTAIQNGAKVIVLEQAQYVKDNDGIVYLIVKDSSLALAQIACNYFDNPSEELTLVGITGTNGKTTTVTLLYELFSLLGYKCGKISTIENIIGTEVTQAQRTTPDSITLNSLLRQMSDAGCRYVFMEVSSHAIVQNRVAGLKFALGIFSNITLDHLDYHKTFANYIKAKKKFFDDLSKEAFALTNIDDKNGEVMLQNTKAKRYTYSLESARSDFRAKILESTFEGLDMIIDNQEVCIPMVGKFNAYNILAVYSAARLLGFEKTEILRNISSLKAAKGRFEIYKLKNSSYAIIDYAHTPDALENVLTTINNCKESLSQRVITVVGCGGNRDKSKRPLMAQIAQRLSQIVILTSDNPRYENPDEIINDMKAGIKDDNDSLAKVLTVVDRHEAIKIACTMAKDKDIILIAGKGHENYQEVNGVKHHFDDKQEIENFGLKQYEGSSLIN